MSDCENCKRLEDALYHESRKAPEVEYKLRHEIEALKAQVEMCKEALGFYANEKTWSPDNFLCGSEVLRSDLDETIWSRFTPGKRAREVLQKLKGSGE